MSLEKQILNLQESIINAYSDTITESDFEKKNYIIVSLVDDVEEGLLAIYGDEVEENLKQDYDYISLESDEETELIVKQREYINENKLDRFLKLYKKQLETTYNYIVNHLEELGYNCYEGEFFNTDSGIEKLNYNQTAFVKR